MSRRSRWGGGETRQDALRARLSKSAGRVAKTVSRREPQSFAAPDSSTKDCRALCARLERPTSGRTVQGQDTNRTVRPGLACERQDGCLCTRERGIPVRSETITVEQLFQNRRQYCVPFYQRPFVWTLEDQWEPLWEDIRAKADARLAGGRFTPHFLGAVVLDPQQQEGLIGVQVVHIIDGQQRLTTLQFVLTSVLLALRRSGNESFADIVIGCLRNPNPGSMRDPAIEVFKVWPTFRDRTSYRDALTSADLADLATRFQAHFTQAGGLRARGMDHPPALAAIWYFTCQFEQWLAAPEGQPAAAQAEALVLAILRDLKLVSIVLDADDDAQIVFETLNGRGATLHATDLIRNYVFMRADRERADSESLYNTLWCSAFENTEWSELQTRGRVQRPRLEWLIHSALQAELHEEVDLGRLYYEYRRFAVAGGAVRTAEQQLLTLTCYARHYRELVSGTSDTPIARFGAGSLNTT